MRQFSTVELTKNSGAVTDAAIKGPVAITHHRKPKFVLMSVEDYEKLRRASDPRRVYRAGETPPELAEVIARRLDEIICESEAGHEE
ncbi:MAG: type II toxin-antitoxin system Phd/YefM family antitoxin [Methylocystis sp.]|nr:type II toxin-antitoxin system Phd/YefM family antitoxin [Methylocystis sp.]